MMIKRELTQTHPGIWRLIAPNPSLMTGPGTNTYLVGGEQLLIIDPGPVNDTHLDHIIAATQSLHASVQAIVVTHHHPDHSGGAGALARRLEVPLLSLGDPLHPDGQIKVAGLTLEIKYTPGHIHDHICLWLARQRLLFSGDLVAGEGTVLIIPPDGDMAAYLDSLHAMQTLAPKAILPGHGPIIEDPLSLLQEYIDHRLMREQQVLDCLAQGYRSAAEIAAHIYADRPQAIGIGSLQIEAHLEKLRREGRI